MSINDHVQAMNNNWDQLEPFIREKRQGFDQVEQPRTELVWSRLQNDLRKAGKPSGNGRQLWIGTYWRWSIVAVLVLGIGVFYLAPRQEPAGEWPDFQLGDYYPELRGRENNYRKLISQKEESLGFSRLDRGQYATIFEELATLEEIRRQYLQDLPRFHDNEQLVETLLKYYEQRIRILERLTMEIEKQKQHEERSRNQLLL